MVMFRNAVRDAAKSRPVMPHYARRNNHALSWWDVIGCNSFGSRMVMIAENTQETFFVIFCFISAVK